MAKSVLEPINMDSLTKGKYIQLLARDYTPRDVFRSLAEGTNMKKSTLRKEFDYWRIQNGIKELKPVRPVVK